VGQAQKAADQAAQRLAQSDLPGAINSMKQAQKAMNGAGQAGKGQQGQQGEGAPSMSDLSKQQAQVQKAAESLLASQQKAPTQALQKAAKKLEHAAETIGPLAAGGELPSSAESALQAAEDALANGTAQAEAGQGPPAQASASSAAQALAQAQAALALAQAGLSSEMAQAGQGQGQGEGQGKGKGQGKGRGQGQGQEGQGTGQGTPGPNGNGRQGNWNGAGGADGPRRSVTGPGQYTGLPKRDRAAIQQSQAEKYPQEYGALVEQYLKNLSDQTGKEQ